MATEPEAAPLARMSSILIIRLLSLENGALSQSEACNLSSRIILSSKKPQKTAPNEFSSTRTIHPFLGVHPTANSSPVGRYPLPAPWSPAIGRQPLHWRKARRGDTVFGQTSVSGEGLTMPHPKSIADPGSAKGADA